jgi:hypothetical protein
MQSFQSTRSGQFEVKQDNVDVLGVQQAVSMFGRVGRASVETHGLGRFPAGLANGAFIVHDHEIQKVCALDLGGIGYKSFGCGHD